MATQVLVAKPKPKSLSCDKCCGVQMIHAGARGEVATQVLVGAPLAYMAAACYYTLARLGVFYFYRVVPGATGSHSLLMNASQARALSCHLHACLVCPGMGRAALASRLDDGQYRMARTVSGTGMDVMLAKAPERTCTLWQLLTRAVTGLVSLAWTCKNA